MTAALPEAGVPPYPTLTRFSRVLSPNPVRTAHGVRTIAFLVRPACGGRVHRRRSARPDVASAGSMPRSLSPTRPAARHVPVQRIAGDRSAPHCCFGTAPQPWADGRLPAKPDGARREGTTLAEGASEAEAFAIGGERFPAVGSLGEVMRWRGPERLLLPRIHQRDAAHPSVA